MATSGIFQLITNDGKQDRMLMATALLNKRLLTIERARSRDPNIKDPTPTLVDIERTHILNEWDEQSYEKIRLVDRAFYLLSLGLRHQLKLETP